ncbi:long-chain-fatty-acid--CoA ligase [Streptomyces sp. NPDC058623]|uniref:long-chain-fatty-acid--CoA ligase n=1 Tax=Streptomyces sp. NPDC058623 TaxID=3346563 RepID=UPI00365D7EAE
MTVMAPLSTELAATATHLRGTLLAERVDQEFRPPLMLTDGERVPHADTFSALGLSSLRLVDIEMALDEALGRRSGLTGLGGSGTVGDFLTHLRSEVLPDLFPDRLHHPGLQHVADTVAFHAVRSPDRPAIECEGRVVTYAALHRESNRAAHALLRAGIGPGSRVGYLGKESEYYYEALFACAKNGAVLVPVNWRLTGPEVDHILRDSGTELLLVEPEFVATLPKAGELPGLRLVVEIDPADPASYQTWKDGSAESDLPRCTGPDDAVAQLYTSGTTGLPKGVVLAHRSFFKIRDALAENGLDWIDWLSGDRSLIGIPGFHVGGLWWAMQGFNAGVTNVSMRMFTSADAVRLIRESGITTACVVPAMLRMMLAEPDLAADDFASLRKVVYGGSPISESLLRSSIEMLGCDLAQIYGLTETGNTSVCLPPHAHVPGSPLLKAAGRPYPGVGLRIVDETGAEVATGTTGEVLLHSPAAMLAYWGLTEATDATLVDGWVHTGDAGYVDADGYLFICDRIKDTVIVAGENVYPAEVENALCKHPAVADAAVVGVPHERWGEAVHAFVALRPGAEVTPRELMRSLKGHLADFKTPSTCEFVDGIPRNPSGKVLRRVLRERFWADRERRVG